MGVKTISCYAHGFFGSGVLTGCFGDRLCLSYEIWGLSCKIWRLGFGIIWRFVYQCVSCLMLAVSWDSWLATYMQSLHLAWASLQHGSCVSKVSMSRGRQLHKIHIAFYNLALEVTLCRFPCNGKMSCFTGAREEQSYSLLKNQMAKFWKSTRDQEYCSGHFGK